MGYSYRTSAEIQILLDHFGNRISAANGSTIRTIALSGPATKRQEFSGDQYLEQIEKNAIYLREGTVSMQMAIVEYLANGKPKLKPEQVEDFVVRTRIERPQTTTPLHLNYVRNGCRACAAHAEHSSYSAFRNLRLTGDWSKYLDEMEYSFIYFQASMMTASQFLYGFLHDHGLAGSAKKAPSRELSQVVLQRVFVWTDLCLNSGA